MITTVTTVTTIAALGVGAITSVALVVALIVILTTRELASTSSYNLAVRIARFTTVGILPLVLAFVVIVVIKITELL